MNIRRTIRRAWWHVTGTRDVIALQRALGYNTPDDALSTMRDGTVPKCGSCESRRLYPHLHDAGKGGR